MRALDPKARREAAAVLAFTIVGGVLRAWSFGRLGMTHFDEGIYARAGSLFIAGMADPGLIPYAPPGYPLLVGLAFLVFGTSDLSAIAVSLLAGTLTIPAAAWLGRRAFGPGAGAAAAALVAVAGPHVVFSRMALTDATFLLLWILALAVGGVFLDRPGIVSAIAFGATVGLAQEVKYSGWLSGVLVGVVALLGVVRPLASRRAAVLTIGFGCVAAIVTTAVYAPWFVFVDQHAGYTALLAHHRSYVHGIDAWPRNWAAQMAQAIALSGGLEWGAAAWASAWISAAFVMRGIDLVRPDARRAWPWFGAGLLGGAIALATMPNLGWWVALALSPGLVLSSQADRRILGVGFVVMALLTPFYHPYARLWLPLHASSWLATAGLIARLQQDPATRSRSTLASATVAALLAIVQAFGTPRAARPLPEILGPSDSLRVATESARKRLPAGSPPLLLLARPPVAFYLATGQPIAFQTAGGIVPLVRSSRPGMYALIDAAQLRQEPILTGSLRRTFARSWIVDDWTTELGPATVLDVAPESAFGDLSAREAPLTLHAFTADAPDDQLPPRPAP